MTDELGFSWCDIQPCLAKTPEGIVLLHVDDVLFCGNGEYLHKVFLEKCQERFSTSYALLKDVGSSISFLKKKMVRVKDGILLVPGANTERIVEAFETDFGPARIQAVPCDSSIQLEDTSQCLNPSDSSKFRSIVGMCLYLGRDRPDVVFAIKELASKMSKPTCTSLQHLRKLVGYLKGTGELGVKLQCPTPGKGKWKTTTEKSWVIETFCDADWMSNREHRRSTSCGLHFLNGCFLMGTSRTQRTIALSSCESELYSIVSSMCDAIYIRRCLEFLLEGQVMQVQFTDSSSARQLLSRQGCGKIRHLSGKVLWVQSKIKDNEVLLIQIPTIWNTSDIGTKALPKKRLRALMCEIGMMDSEGQQHVGELERDEMQNNATTSRNVSKLAKAIMRMSTLLGLEPTNVAAMETQEEFCPLEVQKDNEENFWIWMCVAMLGLAWIVFGVAAFLFWRKLDKRIYNNELQQAQTDTFMCAQRDSLDDARRRVERVDNDLRAHVNQYEMETTMMEDLITTVHYGLVEHGGFVRFTTLSRQQRESMLVQERANMVLHNMQQRAPDNTDAPAGSNLSRSMEDAMEPNEQGEEERQTEDEAMETVEVEVEPEREGDLTKLLRNLRCIINRSLEESRFEDAAEVQTLVLAALEATEQRNGLTAELATNVQNGFQRLYRRARNRGDETTARTYKGYVEDFRLLLG